ncbi:MAG TPA: carbon storage regulator CsrA [Holophaga sp.]|nr:carbon storage regulator CsrA [Holophaga sp.]
MLVITRKLNQSLIINGNIEVLVVGLTKEGVRLGIKAPKDVQVHRREVFDAIADQNRAATTQAREGALSLQDAAALLRARLAKDHPPKDR